MHRYVLMGLLLTFASGCATRDAADQGSPIAPADWLACQEKRHESIGGTNGWSTLIMLHWLEEGTNTIGTDPENQAVLPQGRAAAHVGTFIRSGKTVRFQAAAGVQAVVDNESIQSIEVRSDTNPKPSKIYIGDLSIVVIERGERLGLRVRDPQAPTRLTFKGLNYFPYDPAWRIEGQFEPFSFPRKLRVTDIIGDTQEFHSPGVLVFTHGGNEHRLEVAAEPDDEQYFIMFHDHTAGQTTYPSGRFLYVDRADEEGTVVIDFNRAYTPPCGFTSFATCPLPSPQNRLPFPVNAGELTPSGHH